MEEYKRRIREHSDPYLSIGNPIEYMPSLSGLTQHNELVLQEDLPITHTIIPLPYRLRISKDEDVVSLDIDTWIGRKFVDESGNKYLFCPWFRKYKFYNDEKRLKFYAGSPLYSVRCLRYLVKYYGVRRFIRIFEGCEDSDTHKTIIGTRQHDEHVLGMVHSKEGGTVTWKETTEEIIYDGEIHKIFISYVFINGEVNMETLETFVNKINDAKKANENIYICSTDGMYLTSMFYLFYMKYMTDNDIDVLIAYNNYQYTSFQNGLRLLEYQRKVYYQLVNEGVNECIKYGLIEQVTYLSIIESAEQYLNSESYRKMVNVILFGCFTKTIT